MRKYCNTYVTLPLFKKGPKVCTWKQVAEVLLLVIYRETVEGDLGRCLRAGRVCVSCIPQGWVWPGAVCCAHLVFLAEEITHL